MKPLHLLGALLLTASLPAPAQTVPTLSLEIIPHHYPSRPDKPATIGLADSTSSFHVLLTNVSSSPVEIFDENNSWGYGALPFEITYPDGRKITSAPSQVRAWLANAPITSTIPLHGHYLFSVSFNNKPNQLPFWQNSVLNEQGFATDCRLRAIYHIAPTKESTEKHAWTGTITSAEGSYTIWHPDPSLIQQITAPQPRKRRFLR
jgi:hypothetical protein